MLVLALAGLAVAPARAADADGYGKDAWWYQAMQIEEAHKISTGKGVTIAVIDGPIDPTVPELKGQDVTPVKNFCGGKPTATGPIASHGTGITALLVGNGKGTGPAGAGVAGIAPGAAVRVYAVDAGAADDIQCGTKAFATALAEAVDAARADRVDLINVSGGTTSAAPDLRDATARALAADILVVGAAGQKPDASVLSPAALPGAIAVHAVDRDAKPWTKNVPAQPGTVAISAPGVEVPDAAFFGNRWSSRAVSTGTSAATPLVTGALALVQANYPNATPHQLVSHMIRNPGGTQSFGFTPEYGYGIISLPNMLRSDPEQWPDTDPLAAMSNVGAPSPAPTQSPAVATDSDGNGGMLVAVIVGVILAAAAAAGLLIVRSRARVHGGGLS